MRGIFIYNYEAVILKYIHNCFELIKIATYASDEELLLAMSDIKYYPSFYYSREETDWSNNKILSIRDGDKMTDFCTFEQKYKGSIIVEDQHQAQSIASKLRFYWNRISKVRVAWPHEYDELDVQLRLLYIKIKEVRRPNDKKGACRIVEFSWQSNLFMDSSYDLGLVEKVNIFLTDDQVRIETLDGKEIINNDLIDTING